MRNAQCTASLRFFAEAVFPTNTPQHIPDITVIHSLLLAHRYGSGKCCMRSRRCTIDRPLILLVCLLFCSGLQAQTPACFSPAPLNSNAIIASGSRPLTANQQQTLLQLLEQLNGSWDGKTEGFFCSSSKNKPSRSEDNYDLLADAKLEREKRAGNNARFDLDATLESDNKYPVNETLQYTLHDGVLYSGLSKINPVVIHDLRSNSVTLIESTRQRLKSGGNIQRIIERQIRITNERRIEIKHRYYTQEQLNSYSHWFMRR